MMPTTGAQLRQLRQNMRADDDSLPQRLELFQNFLHLHPCAWVKAGGRLVQEEYLRVMYQRPRQAKPLLHPAREGIHIRVGLVGQADKFQQVVDNRGSFRIGDIIRPCVEIHVFRHL